MSSQVYFLCGVSGAGPTVAMSVGQLSMPGRILPEDAGLSRHPIAAIHGGDPAYNAAALRRLLGEQPGTALAPYPAPCTSALAVRLGLGRRLEVHGAPPGRGGVAEPPR